MTTKQIVGATALLAFSLGFSVSQGELAYFGLCILGVSAFLLLLTFIISLIAKCVDRFISIAKG